MIKLCQKVIGLSANVAGAAYTVNSIADTECGGGG